MDLDTSVKKWIRIVSLVLSLCMFAVISLGVMQAIELYGGFREDLFLSAEDKATHSFTDTDRFCDELIVQLQLISLQTGPYRQQMIQEQLQQEYEQQALQFISDYNTSKANFIRSYIFEALCREEIYEEYTRYFDVSVAFEAPVGMIEDRVMEDDLAPEFVRKLQRVLNGTSGSGFLKYAELLPQSVYEQEERQFWVEISTEYYIGSHPIDFTLALADPAAYFETRYAALVQETDVTEYFETSRISSALKYYIVDPATGESFANVKGSAETLQAEYNKQSISFSVVDGKISQKGLDEAEKRGLLHSGFHPSLNVYVALDTATATGNDAFVTLQNDFEAFEQYNFKDALLWLTILALGCLTCFVVLLVFCHKGRIWIDKLYIELHLLLSVAAAMGLLWFGHELLYMAFSGNHTEYRQVIYLLFGVAAVLGWGVVCELFCSLVRTIKSGQLLQSILIVRICRWLWGEARRFFKTVKGVLTYEPGVMRRYLIPLVLVWLGITVGTCFVMANSPSLPLFILFCLFELFVAYKFAEYMGQLDQAIRGAIYREELTDIDRLPGSLRALVRSQQITADELQRAVEQAVRDERTKAELITNVSHDLKTPLTSVINYIDLLKGCDLEDERATEYLGVLTEKSAKLKRLIEDLIEASKITTGNVVLNKTELSLEELVNQALVEEGEALEERDLTLMYSVHSSPKVVADGGKIYRVLENLLSNARKYSLPGTRVYALIYEDEDYGIFELKNTSKEPLAITPQELKERFVRGDSSRSEEGNGLGLSIADNLCRLNEGTLEIIIDGDLFKAIVKLPKK